MDNFFLELMSTFGKEKRERERGYIIWGVLERMHGAGAGLLQRGGVGSRHRDPYGTGRLG